MTTEINPIVGEYAYLEDETLVALRVSLGDELDDIRTKINAVNSEALTRLRARKGRTLSGANAAIELQRESPKYNPSMLLPLKDGRLPEALLGRVLTKEHIADKWHWGELTKVMKDAGTEDDNVGKLIAEAQEPMAETIRVVRR
jgi:hypothetical protein